MNKLLILILAGAFIVTGLLVFYFQDDIQIIENSPIAKQPAPVAQINSFAECSAKYPVIKTNPAQCKTPDGKSFTQDASNTNPLSDQIQVTQPLPNSLITSPTTVIGQARGNWFFEAQFPVILIDAKGVELGRGAAHAYSDWMTNNFVPFDATFTFAIPSTDTGTLILQNDNPSGDPAKLKQFTIPVKFKY